MSATYRQLRLIARRTLSELDLQPPLDHVELARRLGERRGKPIHMVASTELPPSAAFGITGGDDTQDIVLYEARTSTTSQRLIILHELAHIILEHPRSVVDHSFRTGYDDEYQMISNEALTELIGPGATGRSPTQQPTHPESGGDEQPMEPRWRWPWRRSQPSPRSGRDGSLYSAEIEWEAETLATILLTWIPGYGGYVPPRQNSPLEQVLGDDGEW